MNDKIIELQKIINSTDNIVFFGGAGVSTESGIPDFRSVDGLYNQKYKHPPEVILSRSFFYSHKQEFFDFYREKMICHTAKPNTTHYKLAELERAGKLKAVITQNIDGLHQKAGSVKVIELHGCMDRNYCVNCNERFDSEYIMKAVGIPKCSCGGDIKPDVVLYEEELKQTDIAESVRLVSSANVLIIGGTSLVVYPAAGLIDYFTGSKLVVINKSKTHKDKNADLLITGSLSEVMGSIQI